MKNGLRLKDILKSYVKHNHLNKLKQKEVDMSILIAKKETTKLAIEACKNRLNIKKQPDPDIRSINILNKVLYTGKADIDTINLYRKLDT